MHEVPRIPCFLASAAMRALSLRAFTRRRSVVIVTITVTVTVIAIVIVIIVATYSYIMIVVGFIVTAVTFSVATKECAQSFRQDTQAGSQAVGVMLREQGRSKLCMYMEDSQN